jgi:hypothetical protein
MPCCEGAVHSGGGSGAVTSSFTSNPLDGIKQQAGDGAVVTFNDGTDIDAAAAAAAAADYAIVFVGTLSHEGGDRASLSLDDGCDPTMRNIGTQCRGNNDKQNALVAAVAKAAGAKTVVVASVPGAIVLPWVHDVAAVLTNFLAGQQCGNAIADVLYGAVNPSGRLPLTFPNKDGEWQTSPAQWPGLPDPKDPLYGTQSNVSSAAPHRCIVRGMASQVRQLHRGPARRLPLLRGEEHQVRRRLPLRARAAVGRCRGVRARWRCAAVARFPPVEREPRPLSATPRVVCSHVRSAAPLAPRCPRPRAGTASRIRPSATRTWRSVPRSRPGPSPRR